MVDEATERTTIMASPEQCFDVVTDFERYPQWADDVEEVRILRRDQLGRAVDVEYRVMAMGRTATYKLRYFYGVDPLRLAWRLREGDAVRRLDGEYEFVPCSGQEEQEEETEVTYTLAVELTAPLPGFLKRRAESRIIHVALSELKAYVEGSSGSTG